MLLLDVAPEATGRVCCPVDIQLRKITYGAVIVDSGCPVHLLHAQSAERGDEDSEKEREREKGAHIGGGQK